MRKFIAVLLVLSLLAGMIPSFSEDVIMETTDDIVLTDEMTLGEGLPALDELEDILDLDLEDIDLVDVLDGNETEESGEGDGQALDSGEPEEEGETAEPTGSSEDFVIEDGVLVSYRGAGGDVVIPEGVTCISYDVFKNCTSLTSVSIPDTVTEINNYAFAGCSNLTSIVIPSSVTHLGLSVFRDCA